MTERLDAIFGRTLEVEPECYAAGFLPGHSSDPIAGCAWLIERDTPAFWEGDVQVLLHPRISRCALAYVEHDKGSLSGYKSAGVVTHCFVDRRISRVEPWIEDK